MVYLCKGQDYQRGLFSSGPPSISSEKSWTKGEGKWERISWDEALDTIAEKFGEYKRSFGPESVALCLGEPKGLEFAFAQRFASVFGTPNVATPGAY